VRRRRNNAAAGSEARRKFEFECVKHQVQAHKERFAARLQRRLSVEGECLVYDGSLCDGYPCITFRFKGKHLKMKVHRVFIILKRASPIPVGFDVGHLTGCSTRRCVKHIELQHYKENRTTDPLGEHFASTAAGRSPAS
jgi:hypothetical protein